MDFYITSQQKLNGTVDAIVMKDRPLCSVERRCQVTNQFFPTYNNSNNDIDRTGKMFIPTFE